jgi:hypothetical protein
LALAQNDFGAARDLFDHTASRFGVCLILNSGQSFVFFSGQAHDLIPLEQMRDCLADCRPCSLSFQTRVVAPGSTSASSSSRGGMCVERPRPPLPLAIRTLPADDGNRVDPLLRPRSSRSFSRNERLLAS